MFKKSTSLLFADATEGCQELPREAWTRQAPIMEEVTTSMPENQAPTHDSLRTQTRGSALVQPVEVQVAEASLNEVQTEPGLKAKKPLKAGAALRERKKSNEDSDNVSHADTDSEFTRKVRFDTQLKLASGDGQAESMGFGRAFIMQPIPAQDTRRSLSDEDFDAQEQDGGHHKIGELSATAICGNDITSSCFYVVGELTKNAGVYSPICTLLSSFTLFCYRSIYGEVVTALPLNGGIYNLLLNSATKRTASIAACLTILSYTATGVVSAVSAANYFCSSPVGEGVIGVMPLSVSILAFFACMMLCGMKESSAVASLLFVAHLCVLLVLAIVSVVHLCQNGLDQFQANIAWPKQPSFSQSIFFGFSSAMLGVSGFETSANFVEEQEPGVFPKTLTNMWASVSIINVLLPMLSIAIVPLDHLAGDQSANALGYLALRVSGPLLSNVVAVDALFVLSGAVLTSYVGVCGLVQRMAGDRCLPEFFAVLNSCRGTPHWTIILFFCLCSSLCILMDCKIERLATVYSFSFLLVMALFAFCGVYMKFKRPTLPRTIHTPTAMFVLGFALVSTAFTAVVKHHTPTLKYFFIYYGTTVLMVMLAYMRIPIYMSFLLMMNTSKAAQRAISFLVGDDPQQWIMDEIANLWTLSVVYFTKHANLSQLNRALQYIEENEEARHIRIVHVYKDEEPLPHHLMECTRLLDCVYPMLRVDCIVIPGDFGPAMIEHVTKMIGVEANCMFINCPKQGSSIQISELGGVRVILNPESSLWDRLKRSRQTETVGSYAPMPALTSSPRTSID